MATRYVDNIDIVRPSDLGSGHWQVRNAHAITVVFGKNGSGKSRFLRSWRDNDSDCNHYIVPERTGELSYQSGLLNEQMEGKTRREQSTRNFINNYRQQVVARIQAYFSTRGNVRAQQLPGDPADVEHGETVMQLESRVDIRACGSQLMVGMDVHRVATRPIQVLLGLATGAFTAPVAGQATIEPQKPDSKNQYLRRRWQTLERNVNIKRLNFAFHYGDIAKLGSDAFSKWSEKLPSMEPVLDLYLASLREIGLGELSFLLIVQALETYHRRTTNETILDSDSWNQLRMNLEKTMSDSLTDGPGKTAFVGRLEYFNEVSLRRRFKTLLDSLGQIADEVCGVSRSEFLNSVVGTRNYYTHWDARSERTALRGSDLMHCTSRLIALLELLLLRDIGFSAESRPWTSILDRRIRWLPK